VAGAGEILILVKEEVEEEEQEERASLRGEMGAAASRFVPS
jgi:hypothetical protein